jgi:membrane-associated phospholipid phosphatase
MMNKVTALVLLLIVFKGNAQAIDTTSTAKQHDKIALKQFVVPAVLVTSGALLLNTQANQNIQSDIRKEFGTDFHTSVDNYIQLAPAAQIYAGKYLGFKPKNDFVHQTINIAVANAIMGTVVTVMKHSFKEERPDGSNNLSYPSGHTATAFTNASLLFYEYKDSNLWYASSGYLFATATGVLRIANNKHYASDVLTGAGIGTAVGLLVSYWHPFQSFNLGKSKKTTALVYPQIGNQIGLGLVVQMK